MLEDQWLKLKLQAGSGDAVEQVYEKYRDPLLTLAMALLNDAHAAEDVLHDVFVKLHKSPEARHVHGRLKSYLATCVANRARDRLRRRKRQPHSLDADVDIPSSCDEPEALTIANERSRLVSEAIVQLPYEQREAVALHLSSGLTFRQIARHQNTSISTAKGRYRYGLDKLRSILNGRL